MRSVLVTLIYACFMIGCSAPDASTLTHPKRLYAFPMYLTVPGNTANSGAIYKISDSELDGISEIETVIEGLAFPAGIAVETDGTIYYVERPTQSTGRIMKLASGGTVPEEVYSGLTNPEGVALDLSSRLYVSETSLNRVSRVDSPELLETITENLTGPTSIAADETDNLIISEPSASRVSKVIPDGSREDVLTDVDNPLYAGPGLVGNTFVLENSDGLGTGKAILVPDSGGSSNYLSNLINPKSFAWEDGTILYVAEGAPVFRIIKYSTVSSIRTKLATVPGEPHSIALTPLN